MRYFEDVRPGEIVSLGSVTVTEAEIIAYGQRYDPQPFHVDPVAARDSVFGGLVASGWHTCALMMRLTVEASRRDTSVTLGSPGVDSCRWLRPVRPGDTLTGTSEVLETWTSRSKPMGFVRRRTELANQRGELVLTLIGIMIYARRPEGAR
ncbi:MAG: MaoC family dehydratase [Candidatus Rokubacteria bacterium]|nr:MaoC family dehydratase [Candidatus Rokubacteria bacterium]